MNGKLIFFIAILLAASGVFSAPVALVAGLIFGLVFVAHPYGEESRALSRLLLQASVVGLGFGMIWPRWCMPAAVALFTQRSAFPLPPV